MQSVDLTRGYVHYLQTCGYSETQQKIVLAAISLFSEYGYANVSTAKITQRAGVGEATLFTL